MPKLRRSTNVVPLLDGISAILAGALFALSLIWTNVGDLGVLVHQSGDYASGIIVVVGGITSLSPALWAIVTVCGTRPSDEPL